mgnify:FL=1
MGNRLRIIKEAVASNNEATATHAQMADHYDKVVKDLQGQSAKAVYDRYKGNKHWARAHENHIKLMKANAEKHRSLATESLDETLRTYKPKPNKRTAEELYHHHMGKHYEHWDEAGYLQSTGKEERADHHYGKAEEHASKAEEYAAIHFKKTLGQKIKDTGYTGDSPHVIG